MPIKEYLNDSLKINKAPIPWSRMSLSSLSITLPLIIGLFRKEIEIAMLGSLFSLILILNDHFGSLKNRIQHLIITFTFLIASQIFGALLIENLPVQYFCLFVLAFLLGKIKNHGPELERMILFSILYMITFADGPNIKNQSTGNILYATISFTIYLLFLITINFFNLGIIETINRKRATTKTAVTSNSSNYFSFIYATATTSSLIISKLLNLERAYWITGTVLIVMLPDQYSSYVKSFQRLFGTILGVIFASLLMTMTKSPIIIIFLLQFLLSCHLLG